MSVRNKSLVSLISLLFILLSLSTVEAQKKSKKDELPKGKAIMWETVNVRGRDLYWGPGGREMFPDLSRITFIKEEKEGHNKKYRIKDGKGRVWVAKLGREAQPETAAVRLMWAIGYKTEINYLVPTITIPGIGTFKNVRLEARPANIERLDEWKWKDNPFIGTNEFQGLKIMQVFFNNWDIVDVQNKILEVKGRRGTELHYIISDLGATFGKLGNNNLWVIYRLGRKTNDPEAYVKSSFIDEIEDGYVDLAYKGKNRDLFEDITVSQARWLAGLLNQLTDKQIEDAFRAARYSSAEIQLLKQGVKRRIAELSNAGRERNVARSRE